MLKLVVNEFNSLNNKNRFITFSILTVSLIFSFISGVIFTFKDFQNVTMFNIGFESLQIAILLFMEGVAIGILLNLIDKKKLKNSKF